MGAMTYIDVPKSQVKLLNKGNLNTAIVSIDLSRLWEQIIQYNGIYVQVELTIGVLQGILPQTLLLNLGEAFMVSTIDPQTKTVTLYGDFPGIINPNQENVASGKAQVLYYKIV
ncbi:MAG: hypothetical protein ACRCTE_13760 [Cellulosilyticaceae bacterium]